MNKQEYPLNSEYKTFYKTVALASAATIAVRNAQYLTAMQSAKDELEILSPQCRIISQAQSVQSVLTAVASYTVTINYVDRNW